MSNENKNQGLEYNILGCVVRVKADDKDNKNAQLAVNALNDEINSLKSKNPNIKDIDAAVLSALNIANKSLQVNSEYKENIFALRSGVEDALKFIEEVSSQNNNHTTT